MAILNWTGTAEDDTYVAPLDIGNAYESASLDGGDGDDHLTGLVNDQNLISGGTGNDTLVGGFLQNELHGDDGDDVLDSQAGSGSRLYGGSGNDFLIGASAGSSTLDGGSGNDTMVGGAGLNIYTVDSAFDIVVETFVPTPGGNPNPLDTVRSTVSYTLGANVEAMFLDGVDAIDGTGNGIANHMTGNTAANTLAGLAGHDSLFGGLGVDQLLGGKGDDLLDGQGGADVLTGGLGNDQLRVDDAGDTLVELESGGNDTVQSSVSCTLGEDLWVETLRLTGAAAIDATGNSRANTLAGNSGNNLLQGLGGFDTASFAFVNSAVNVNLQAAGANAVGQGNDSLEGIEGLTGSSLADTLGGDDGANVLDGGAGNDSLTGLAGADLYIVDSLGDVINESGLDAVQDGVQAQVNWVLGANLEILTLAGNALNGTGNTLANELNGNAGANALSGSGGNDTLRGFAGNDTLTGGTGVDVMEGGAGADRYSVDAVGDSAVEAATAGEIDTVVASINWTLGANLENLELAGSAHLGTGNTLANKLLGGSGNDTLDGGSGNDTMDGGSGNDVYFVDTASDVVSELFTSTGTDEVRSTVSYTLSSLQIERLTLLGTGNLAATGSSGNNLLTGNSGSNTLSGGFGNDSLVGNAGNDLLRGGAGTDTIVGGLGNDIVQLDSTSGSDAVTGFVSGTDDLRLAQATLKIGDGDTLVEFSTTRAAAGGFSSAAELVVFTANQAGLAASNAAAAIGSATSAFAVGATRLYVIDNGLSSTVWRFTAADANAVVASSELVLLATLTGTASTTTGDYLFGG